MIEKQIKSIKIADEILDYELLRSKKRKYSLAMKIRNDGMLQLNVPYTTSVADIESFISNKYAWIIKTRAKQAHKCIIKPQYNFGEKHYYLGKAYPLQLISSSQSKIEIGKDSLLVFHRKNASIKKILNVWYKQQATILLSQRTLELQKKFGFPTVAEIKLRQMKARWGSCSSAAIITYNTKLIKAAINHIDYVIIHELCHLIHQNHGKGFYRLQQQCNPQWKQQKQALNHLAHLYLN